MSLFLLELLLVELLERRTRRRALDLEYERGRAWVEGMREGVGMGVNLGRLVQDQEPPFALDVKITRP